jgi:alkyldihydroxyacetonephosphate synthase
MPFGAGSGVCGAVVSDRSPVVIDLRAMNRIVNLDERAALLEVEAGAIAGDVEKWLNARGFTLGHYPQSMPLATMGGLVSTRSSGTFSGKYGNIEDLVAGLDVVLASGEIVRTPRTVRSATGPDLKQMFVGAEGTLGLITRVAVRVFRMPERRWFGGYAFPSVEAGIEAVRRAYELHLRPAVLRLYDATEAASLYRRVDFSETVPLLIVGHEGRARMVQAEREEFAAVARENGGRELGPAIGDAWERHRFDASWLVSGNDGAARFADAIEVSAVWPQLVPLYQEAMRRIAPMCTSVMGHYSHFYSTGAALYIIFFVEGTAAADAVRQYRQVWNEVMAATRAHGGSVSHHHGIGRARADTLAAELGSAACVLRALKQALDPDSLFNPGHRLERKPS